MICNAMLFDIKQAADPEGKFSGECRMDGGNPGFCTAALGLNMGNGTGG